MIHVPEDDDDKDTAHTGSSKSSADIVGAYTALNKGLAQSLSGDVMGPLLKKFRIDAGLNDAVMRSFKSQIVPPRFEPPAPLGIRPAMADMPDLPTIRPITADIAESADRMTELMELQHEAIAQLVAMTGTSLQHTEAQRQASERTERFTRRMAWGSLGVAVASLAAAVGALIVSVVTGAG